jgi:hypothetical protein
VTKDDRWSGGGRWSGDGGAELKASELLNESPKGCRVGALSNMSAVHWDAIVATGLTRRFDRLLPHHAILGVRSHLEWLGRRGSRTTIFGRYLCRRRCVLSLSTRP